jgi:signal transduction histidine kinase
VEAGKMELAEGDFCLADLIDDSVTTLTPRAVTNGIVLKSLPGEPALRCRGDLFRLRQALLNLLSNAIKFTPAGGHVTLTAQRDDAGRLVIAVQDTGRGIAAADMPKLFQPFAQAGHLLARPAEGTGLGLVLTRRFVEMHGGVTWLESHEDAGTTAYIALPASRVGLISSEEPTA